jgi:hypothetical protein
MSKAMIDDYRSMKEFNKITFSGYKIIDVVKKMLDSIVKSKIENSCYWCAELLCSGHYEELWEVILFYYSKHVHIANPKLAIYLDSKMTNFKENMNDAENSQEQLNFRNEQPFRVMFCEIITILCLSDKKYTLQPVSVPEDDYDLINLKNNLCAPDLSEGEKVVKPDDPKELVVIMNELLYNISTSISSTTKSYYWVEWLLGYAKLCKKKKQICLIEKREYVNVEEKYQRNIVWLIWEAIKQESKKRNTLINKIINSLFSLFTVRYSETHNTKRKHLLLFSITLLTNSNIINNIEIVKDKSKLSCVMTQLDTIFMQVKENEIKTKDDKEDKEPSSTGSTIDKMKIINNFEQTYIPRI